MRSGDELAGLLRQRRRTRTRTPSLFRIDVIKVPLAAPAGREASSNSPRHLRRPEPATSPASGRAAHHGEGTQTTAETNQCHDITVYPEIGLAAGACSGNGILLDIRDPANPKRIDEVSDPNFAYWHSATFSNDGTKVLFTDEWGGGTQPRCRATDQPQWGADAIFTLASGKMHARRLLQAAGAADATRRTASRTTAR